MRSIKSWFDDLMNKIDNFKQFVRETFEEKY